MPLHIDSNPSDFQVLDEEGNEKPHPETFDTVLCPYCKAKMHGHGWRKRWLTRKGKTIRIWVHRMKCPVCGHSVTMLPNDVAPLCIYGMEDIASAIKERIGEGHFPTKSESGAPVRLRRLWWKNFLQRCRMARPLVLEAEAMKDHLAKIRPVCGVTARLKMIDLHEKDPPTPEERSRPTIKTFYFINTGGTTLEAS